MDVPTVESEHVDQGDAIARDLGKIWTTRAQEAFSQYVLHTYGVRFVEPPAWIRVVISESASADIAAMAFNSPIVRRWWTFDAAGLVEEPEVKLDLGQTGMFFKTPILRFFVEGERVLVSEHLGPRLLCKTIRPILRSQRAFCPSEALRTKVL